MKKQYVSDLKVGTSVSSLFVVSRKSVKKKKNNDDYCAVTLQDREGSIEGIIWTDVFKNIGYFEEGDFVLVKGNVSEYRGGKQLSISSMAKIKNKEDIEYSDFVKTTKENVDDMMSEIKSYINSIRNQYLRKLLDLFFKDEDFTRRFCHATAAVRYHHAYSGGLLEHTLSVTKICDFLSGAYKNLNRDLIISGAILHDVGKIKEYDVGVIIKVTDEGKLLGHITIGYGLVLEKIKKISDFPEDLRERLLHIILSHHGHKEFGSPRRPKILEAFVVYHVDHMDADIGGYNIILEESNEEDEWSAYAKNFERSVMLKKPELENSDQKSAGTDEKEKFGEKGLGVDIETNDGRNERNLTEKENKDKKAQQKSTKQDELF